MTDKSRASKSRRRSSHFVTVRQREMLGGEHGTACYIEAERRERAAKRKAQKEAK